MLFQYKLPDKNISDKKRARIKNPSRRFDYLLRKYFEHELYKLNEEQLQGLLDMIDGLCYHHKNYLLAESCGKKNNDILLKAMNDSGTKGTGCVKYHSHYDKNHEFNAYSNRVGQIYSLFTSSELKNIGYKKNGFLENNKEKWPNFCKYLFIRNKYTAHRIKDYPKKNEVPYLGLNSPRLCFAFTGVGKIEEFLKNSNATIYFPDPHCLFSNENCKLIEYVLSKDHDKVIRDIENMFEGLFI